MTLEVKVLDLGDIELETSFLVLARNPGEIAHVPTFGYLILGGEAPVLVDTGYRVPKIMERLGMVGIQTEEQLLENQLKQHGLKYGDVKYILHTHLHIDHAGKDDQFPDNTTVVINRRELEFSVSGIMGEQYPAEDVKHLVDRLHSHRALRLLDLELSGPEEIMPGVTCEAAGAHTDGSMNILIETSEGTVCVCGDVIYDINDQLVNPLYQVLASEPATTGNHGCTKRGEKASIKKMLNSSRFLAPIHDRPALIEGGQVVGRAHDSMPGPIVEKLEPRNWFPV